MLQAGLLNPSLLYCLLLACASHTSMTLVTLPSSHICSSGIQMATFHLKILYTSRAILPQDLGSSFTSHPAMSQSFLWLSPFIHPVYAKSPLATLFFLLPQTQTTTNPSDLAPKPQFLSELGVWLSGKLACTRLALMSSVFPTLPRSVPNCYLLPTALQGPSHCLSTVTLAL